MTTTTAPPILDIDFTAPGATLDPAIWTVQADKRPNRDGALFVDDPRTVFVDRKGLHLRAVNAGGSWLAGEVSTVGKRSWTYGRFEVDAIVNPPVGPGFQSTFWLWPVNVLAYGPVWPESGEVDFAEFYSLYPNYVVPCLHYPLDFIRGQINAYTTHWGYDARQPHTFGVEWTPGQLRVTLDGHPVLTDAYQPLTVKEPAPFDKPFFLTLTQTVGQGKNAPTSHTAASCETVVQRVRVWGWTA